MKEMDGSEAVEQRVAKRQKQTSQGPSPQIDLHQALGKWKEWFVQHQKGTDEIWKVNYGDKWEAAKKVDMDRLRGGQAGAKIRQELLQAKIPSAGKLVEDTRNMLTAQRLYKEDIHPRY